MNTLTKTLLSISLLAAASGIAVAQNGPRYDQPHHGEQTLRDDVARVTRVERIAQRNDRYQRQECWNERNSRQDGDYYRDEDGRLYRGDGSNKNTRTVIGALIGGVLGSQVGSGRGRTAATVAGAVAGGAIGRDSADNDRGRNDGYDGYDRYRDDSGQEFRCRTMAEQRGRGRDRGRDVYRVSYTYAGKTYSALTNAAPGRTMRVQVDVRPQPGLVVGSR